MNLSTRSIYTLLALLFAIAAARRVTYTIDAVRDMSHRYTKAPFTIAEPWPTVADETKSAKAAGLLPGDRILAVEGRVPFGSRDFAEAYHNRGIQEAIPIEVLRGGVRMRVAPPPAVAAFGDVWLSIAFASFSWIVMPWLCFALGFWVAALRPRDGRAWIVLGILLGVAEQTTAGVLDPLGWPGIGPPMTIYRDLAAPVWAACMLLFGIYFPRQWRFDRYAPSVKWVLLAPLSLMFWVVANDLALALDHNLSQKQFPRLPLIILQTVTIVMPCGFFIALYDKSRQDDLPPDDRRRLKLLYWGCTAALTPMFLLILYTLIVHQRMPGDSEDLALAIAFMAMLLFPLTMAYVLVVERAMDVRMAIRQGVQYALARRGLRVMQSLLTAAAVLLAVNAMNSGASRPLKLTLLTVGIVAAFRVRYFGEKARAWLDRRFFREAYNAEQILSDLSEQVRTILDTRTLLHTVARKISESLHVERVAVMLRDGAFFRLALAEGYEPPLEWALQGDSSAIEPLRRAREPVAPPPDGPLSPLRAQLVLPLASKKELLGFIGLGPKKSQEPYSPSDAQLLRTVAAQTGMALENSRLSEAIAAEMAQRETLSREIEIAREVQQRLFPQTMPLIEGLVYAGYCLPARGVGGDYYDFLELPHGCLGVAIGDVSGKGIPAALLMASLQASVRGQSLSRGSDIAGLTANVNRLVYDASPSNRYATFFYAHYDPSERRLVYVNGGHNPPLILRAEEIIRLETGGPPVGLFRAAQYEQAEARLQPEDLLVLFTDGVSEAENPWSDEWGEEALIAAARASCNAPPEEIVRRIMRAAEDFAAGAPQHDDMTLVVMRVA